MHEHKRQYTNIRDKGIPKREEGEYKRNGIQ